jgi:hypothetical protein
LSKLRRLYKQIFKENRYSLDNVWLINIPEWPTGSFREY